GIDLGPTLLPSRPLLSPAAPSGAPSFQNWLRHLERRMRPPKRLSRRCDFITTERRAVHSSRPLLFGGAKPDRGLAGDEPGLAAIRTGARDGGGHGVRIVPIDCSRVPTSGLEAPNLILGGGKRSGPVDGDSIVVEQHNQLAQPKVPRKRDGLLADAFHQAAIARDHIRVVINNVGPETRVPDAFCNRHSDRGGNALA